MRAVIQRVISASVEIDAATVARIGPGLLVLAGIGREDTEADGSWLCGKISRLRIFDDENGFMNRSLAESAGEVLLVSQFTLFGSLRKGNRPSFNEAAPPELARPLYEKLVEQMQAAIGRPVQTGTFAAAMRVSLVNDGPVTLILDTRERALPRSA